MDEERGYSLEHARAELPFLRDVTYLSTGTFGLMAQPVLQHHLSAIEYRERCGHFANQEALDAYEHSRATVANLVHAAPDEIALTRNATDGVNMVVAGLRLSADDLILTSSEEHPAVLLPLGAGERAGRAAARIFELKNDPEATLESFERSLTSSVRLVVFSHITSETGMRLPAAEICRRCRERGILTMVDGAQSVGQIPINVQELGCDFFTGNGHKWLCGPKGTGFLYVRRELLGRLVPAYLGSGSVDFTGDRQLFRERPGGDSWHLTPSARRFEYTTSNWQTFAALASAVDYLGALGWDAIERHCANLSDELKDGLGNERAFTLHTPRAWEHSSGLVTFSVEGWDGPDLSQCLWNEYRVLQRPSQLTNGVRISCAYFNSSDDLNRLMDALRALA